VLYKVRETKPQSQIRENEKRMLNVRDAFACKTDLEDANVLLVDDVYTSGYTAKNCAKALKVAGVDKIYVLTAARARCKPAKRKVAYQRIEDMVFRRSGTTAI
jgi:predicted amidophosphoribosyltransferase